MKTQDFIKREWAMWILILIPTILSIVNWNSFPDKIPTHWGIDGEVNDYSGKWAVFLGPLVATGIYLLMLALPKIDPRKKNYDLFSGAYWMIRIALVLLMSLVGVVTDLFSLGYHLNVGMIVQVSVLGLFLLLGNQMGRIRPNYFVGIRTPWTLDSEEVWTKTHRMGGRIWVGTSIALIICVFFIPIKIFAILFFVSIILITVIPVVYSYFIHKKIKSENPASKH
ncbi:MAG TPA: SdpI family protein [Bacteroidia bacterium]|nr:SdpI family protein [Bacteroidia bacterium]